MRYSFGNETPPIKRRNTRKHAIKEKTKINSNAQPNTKQNHSFKKNIKKTLTPELIK